MMYFYDSYALIAYFQGNQNYARYFEEHEGITTYGNVLEVFYAFLREENPDGARRALRYLSTILKEPEISDIEPAMRFKHAHKKLRLSYVDCLGYAVAKRIGCVFLTGDADFKDMENVEFVKAQ